MSLPNFDFELSLWSKGYPLVAGIDEVGRGCFAGPVVAGIVVFPKKIKLNSFRNVTINDSKKLTPRQRNIADNWIRNNALHFGIGVSSVAKINKFGIKKATFIAFRRAIAKIRVNPDHLLLDAFYLPHAKGVKKSKQTAIIKGDQKSLSIAAGSIIAKVYRDSLMVKLGVNKNFKVYDWHKNKGYGTLSHRKALIEFGPTKHHRTLFVDTFLKNTKVVLSK